MLFLALLFSNTRICSHLLHSLALPLENITALKKFTPGQGACLSAGDTVLAVLSFCSNAAL